jgi:hypothetical protein
MGLPEPVDFGAGGDLSPLELRDKIEQLEGVMLQMKEEQIEIEPKHYFAEGLYAREITIPKGTTLTGKIHKFEHLNIISKGDISVMTEAGIKRIQAPATIISQPGTKRVGYAHEDTVWTTIHATTERDLVKLEDILVTNSYVALDATITQKLEGA